ncbi:RNA-binding protein 1 [Phtheirospermum japonicum]|uniref:RNA-binding protein 1 n=1 Tax=Phtheirospermum japonicum TaxID=374723 RepID=A0A830BD90_9LAMI|nr:RNA-binding protein 1 [Phtheirospermum japonicum]
MEDAEPNKLFVGGISWETTEDILNEHFDKYGAVLSSVVAKDRISGQPRGFAFVTFSESSAVDGALQDSHQILSRTVEVKRAIPRSEQQSQQQHNRGLSRNISRTNGRSNDEFRTKKIFVGGLSANLTEDEFRSYFSKFGRITDVVVMHDNMTHRPRGFGFITFDSEDSVEEVMQKNFHELTGKLVEVKRAVPKDGSSSSSNGYNGSGGRGSNFNSYHQLGNNYVPYDNSRFGYFPAGYGNVAGYPYGAGIFGGGYPSGGYGGVGYGLTPIGPRNPWAPAMIGVRGSFLPYGSATPVYPAYLNGGPGVMGLSANGYSGILGTGLSGKSGQMGREDAQHAAESTLSQIGTNNVDTNSFGSGRGLGAGASRQSKKENWISFLVMHILLGIQNAPDLNFQVVLSWDLPVMIWFQLWLLVVNGNIVLFEIYMKRRNSQSLPSESLDLCGLFVIYDPLFLACDIVPGYGIKSGFVDGLCRIVRPPASAAPGDVLLLNRLARIHSERGSINQRTWRERGIEPGAAIQSTDWKCSRSTALLVDRLKPQDRLDSREFGRFGQRS